MRTDYYKPIAKMSHQEKLDIALRWRILAYNILAKEENLSTLIQTIPNELKYEGKVYEWLKRRIESNNLTYFDLFYEAQREARKFENMVLNSHMYGEIRG